MIRIIANPTAGGGRALGEASRLARACADAGIPTHVHVSSDRRDTIRTAREAAALGLVVACGGDGTIHDCLNGVMQAEDQAPRLGIWSVGTGNDIERGLRLTRQGSLESSGTKDESVTGDPRSIAAFVDAVVEGVFRSVDVGTVTCDQDDSTQHFLGVLSCGFDSDVNERANAMPVRVGKARYLLGVARELPGVRPRWYAIDSDGRDRSMAGMVVAIGNGPAYGSGMLVCPGADMSDGALDVTLVTDTTRRTFVSVLPKVYSGRHIDHPSVVSWTAKRIRIDAPDAIVYADGERVGPLPAVISVLPSALEVLDTYRT